MYNDKTTLHERFEGVTVQGHLTTAIKHGKKWIEDYDKKEVTIFLRSAKGYDICAMFDMVGERLIYREMDIEGYEFTPTLSDRLKVINIANGLYSEEMDNVAAANAPYEPYDTAESLGFSNSDFIFP